MSIKQDRKPGRHFYVAVYLALFGLGITIFNILIAPTPEHVYEVSDLSYSKVLKLFQDDVQNIVVMHDLGTDTLSDMEDYIFLRDRLAQADAETETLAPMAYVPVSDNASSDGETLDQDGFPVLRLDIAGERIQGNTLEFTIEDYDPRFVYYLDFGNGSRRQIGRVSSYIYPRPGWFHLRLIAQPQDNEEKQRVYSKTLKIGSESIASMGNNPPVSPPVFQDPDWAESSQSGTTPSGSKDIEISDLWNNDSSEQYSHLQQLNEQNQGVTIKDSSLTPTVEIVPQALPQTQVVATSLNPSQSEEASVGAEVMPVFPGGGKAMQRYFAKNARYPAQAQKNMVEGSVLIRAVVRTDGKLTNIKVIKGIGSGCDEEAIRLIKGMPRWISGMQDGNPVPVYTVVPVHFKLVR